MATVEEAKAARRASRIVNRRLWRGLGYRSLTEYVAANHCDRPDNKARLGEAVAEYCQLALVGDAYRSGLRQDDLTAPRSGRVPFRECALRALWYRDGLPRQLWGPHKFRYLAPSHRRMKHRHRPWMVCNVWCPMYGSKWTTR